MSDQFSIRTALRCGDLGRIITLHSEVYEPLGGYGLRFEAFVCRTFAEFVLENDAQGQIWLLERDGVLLGCAAVALRENGVGQIRWVVLAPVLRGRGIGRELVEKTLAYCREQGCNRVILDTADDLTEAQSLYESFGFVVTSNKLVDLWDGPRALIVMELDLE